MKKTQDIRRQFIQYFEQKKHTYIPPTPITQPKNEDILFVNAGVIPFVPYLLEESIPPAKRIVNSQPCLRVAGKHNDLEEVGYDTYHHTFFEMLGNWSFGDYTREKAIEWAWQLLTQVYQIDPKRLYATVFEGDTQEQLKPDKQSLDLWKRYLPLAHILYGNKKDNFWEMGSTGPCGPCSELHVDLRSVQEIEKVPGHALVNKDHPEVIELWNLVFVAYERQQNGSLQPLARQHIDTGMGLERLAMVLQGTRSTYDTDLFQPLIQWLEKNTKHTYGQAPLPDRAMRTIADHIRAAGFLIADGTLPSTQKRGYVLRRILRRAIRYGYSYLSLKIPFLYQMVPIFVDIFASTYPHLEAQASLLSNTIKEEEKRFLHTLSSGLKRVQQLISTIDENTKNIHGSDLFELYDTFGFPLDLTRLIMKENGYEVDESGFIAAMNVQKTRSKKAGTRTIGDWQVIYTDTPHSHFVGYDGLESKVKIIKYRLCSTKESEMYQIILNQTPFYPEGGGQVGDKGVLQFEKETIPIIDTKKENGIIIHYTTTLPSNCRLPCKAIVDETRRTHIMRNHSATHLLHAALRQVLGKEVTQKGSLVNDEYLRFDFSYAQKISEDTLRKVQNIVNKKIRDNIPLEEKRRVLLKDARTMGAVALFGEKYGEHVRVITFDKSFSVELCGGTHVQNTGEIGFFYLGSSTGIGAGIRRIEAFTGYAAEKIVTKLTTQLQAIGHLVNNAQTPVKAISALVNSHKKLQKKMQKIMNKQLQHTLGLLNRQWESAYQTQNTGYVHKNTIRYGGKVYAIDSGNLEVNEPMSLTYGKTPTWRNMSVLIKKVETPNPDFLKKLAIGLTNKRTNSCVFLGTVLEGQVHVVIALGKQTPPQLNANNLMQKIKKLIDGQGGGQAKFAMGKGSNEKGLSIALSEIQNKIGAGITNF
ncbi:MAG: alanine--tRNA ligase [Bacteroidota bacterium]